MSKKTTQSRVRVLYQNLNGVWYAFAENGGDVYIGKVPVKVATPKTAKKGRARAATAKADAEGTA